MNHPETESREKRARILYLELCALGLDVSVERDARRPDTYCLVVGSLCSLTPRHADRVVRRVRENEAELTRVLLSDHDPEIRAVRTEGRLR